MIDKDLAKNASGYHDPTAYQAFNNIGNDDEKVHKVIHVIRGICDLAGLDIRGRITFVDRKTGRVFK